MIKAIRVFPRHSVRQVEVLRLIAQGKTNHEIAQELVLSERTVQRHLGHATAEMTRRYQRRRDRFRINLTKAAGL